MFKLNTMTIWNSKQPRTLSTYILIFHISQASHVLLIYITMWIEWLMFKFNTTMILNSKQVSNIWVHSHTGPFKLETILSLHLFSAPHPKSTMHLQSMHHSFWLNPLMVPEARQSLLQCHHYPNKGTAILKCWCSQHLMIAVLLFSWSVLLLLLCVTLTILWFEFSPRICILNSCRDVLRSYELNLLRQFLLQFQPGWNWYGQPFNSSHLKCLLNLFCRKFF